MGLSALDYVACLLWACAVVSVGVLLIHLWSYVVCIIGVLAAVVLLAASTVD